MDENEKLKGELLELVIEYCESENLFKLADAVNIASEIMRIEKFPIRKYNKWKKEKNQK